MVNFFTNTQIGELRSIILEHFESMDNFICEQDKNVCKITYNDSYNFIANSSMRGLDINMNPNIYLESVGMLSSIIPYSTHKFIDVKSKFKEWVLSIKSEMENEGIWDKPNYFNFSTSYARGVINEKFSTDEQIQIKLELELLKQELSEREDLKKSLMHINIKLDVLGDMVSELSKINWRDHAIGAMMGLAADGLAANDEVKSVASKLVSFVSDNISKLKEYPL